MFRYVTRSGVGVIAWRQSEEVAVATTCAPRDNHRRINSRGRVVRGVVGYGVSGVGSATGTPASITLTAATGTASATGGGVGNATGSLAAISLTAATVAVSGGLRRYKHYRKGYLKRGNEVLVFDSEELAEQFEAAEIEAAQAISRAKRKKARIAIPKPAEKVSIARVERQAVAYEIPANVQNMVAALDYEQIVLLNKRIADMQDEEDIELLLL